MDEQIEIAPPEKVRKGWPKGKPRGTRTAGVSPDTLALIEQMRAQNEAQLEELRRARQEQPKAQAEAFAKIQNPSNVVPTGRSAFNPRGDKLNDYAMPRLKCEIHAPWKIHPEYHGLDREEVELFNLLEPGEYRIELNDGTPQKIVVVARRHAISGEFTALTMGGPLDDKGHPTALFTKELKERFPPMRTMLRDMLGARATGVLTMKQETALIAAGELTVSV